MADIKVKDFKQGDRFSFSYQYGEGDEAVTGAAATLIADVRSYLGGAALATLDVVEDEAVAGLYHFSTDADTTTWPVNVKVDVWHTDTELHDDTLIFGFGEAVTNGRHRS